MPPYPTFMKRNYDRYNTTGIHLGYVQPMQSDGWQVGGIITGNWKSHPKIPEYELENTRNRSLTAGSIYWRETVGVGKDGGAVPASAGSATTHRRVL